jgi:hypothetical protein
MSLDARPPWSVTAADLRRRVDALVADTAPLRSVAGVGVVADADVVDAFVAEASDAFVVVRDGADLAGALARVAATGRPLLLCCDAGLQAGSPLLACAQAIADRRPFAHEGQAWSTGSNQAAVVVAVGAEDYEGLPRPLQRIDFWEFLA